MNRMHTMSAVEMVAALRTREISAQELVTMYLKRIERFGGRDSLNAVCEINMNAHEEAKEFDNDPASRESMLCGLPVLIKDNIDVKGMHTTAGSFALADNMATADAPVVANLRRNGAIILGKTNMTEFANYTTRGMPNGFSSLGGQVKNAYGEDMDPGGSSSGSGVAVSAGLCPAAVGTDTSFSIVWCAMDNGVSGYKPPHGTLPLGGIVPIAGTLDSPGPMTRDLRDALLLYNAMRDTPYGDVEAAAPSAVRLAVNTYALDKVSETDRARYDALLDAFKDDGGNVAEVSHPSIMQQKDIMRCEFKAGLEGYLAGRNIQRHTLEEIIEAYEADPAQMPYGITSLQDACTSGMNDAAYADAMEARRKLGAEMREAMAGYDACLMMGPTNIMHFLGWPSVALRLGMGEDGAPRGMILYGPDERRLLSAALRLEKYGADIQGPPAYNM